MKIFEEAAAQGEITGDDAFTLQATYGFPIELTQELARERGLGVNDEEYTRLMEEHREISRQTSKVQIDVRFRDAPRTEFVGYERTEVLTAITRIRRSRRRALPGEARAVAVLSGGRRPGRRHRLHRAGRRRRAPSSSRRYGSTHDQELVFRGEGFAEGDRVQARSSRGASATRRRRTTPRRTCCTSACARCSATTSSRPARPCVRTSSASTSRIRRR